MKFVKKDVAEFTKKPAREVVYERLRPTYADTVEGQLALAEWCKQNQLLAARIQPRCGIHGNSANSNRSNAITS